MAANQFRTLFRVLGEDPDIVSFKDSRPTRKRVVELINICSCAPEEIRKHVETVVENTQANGWAIDACDALDRKLASNGVKKLTVSKPVVVKSNGVKKPSNGNNGGKKLTVSKPVVAESNDEKEPSNGDDAVESDDEDELSNGDDSVEVVIDSETVVDDSTPEMVTAVVAAVVDVILPLLAKVRADFSETIDKELGGLDAFLERLIPLVEAMSASKAVVEVLNAPKDAVKIPGTLPNNAVKVPGSLPNVKRVKQSLQDMMASRPPFV
jgi:hypothetical protein